jgi:hypothetical protein
MSTIPNVGRATQPSRPWALQTAAAALMACAALTACQRTDAVPGPAGPAAGTTQTPASTPPERIAVPASGADTSVPDAGRALAAEGAPASAPGSGEPTSNQRSGITARQQSQSMPLPGQANDHSNTAGEKSGAASAAVPAQRASAPR